MEPSQPFRIDGAVISESTPIAETIKASSNESLVNMFHNYLSAVLYTYTGGIWEVVNSGKSQIYITFHTNLLNHFTNKFNSLCKNPK